MTDRKAPDAPGYSNFVLGALFKNEITWAGIRYRVKAGGDTTVISRNS